MWLQNKKTSLYQSPPEKIQSRLQPICASIETNQVPKTLDSKTQHGYRWTVTTSYWQCERKYE